MKPNFEFVVDGITQDQAEKLLDIIVAVIEIMGGTIGGGFFYKKEDDDEEP